MRSGNVRICLSMALVAGMVWFTTPRRSGADDCPDKCPVDRVCPDALAPCVAIKSGTVYSCSPQQSSDNQYGPFYQDAATADYHTSPNDGMPPMRPKGPANLKCYDQYLCTLNYGTNPPTCVFVPGAPILIKMYQSATSGCEECLAVVPLPK